MNSSPVEYYSKVGCDYLMWDGLYNGHVAQIRRKRDGSMHCLLNAHVDIEFDYPNMSDAVKGHQVPYKGKRYWVIEVDSEHPFEWVDFEAANSAIYDKSMQYVIATVRDVKDGSFAVQTATQCESGLFADDLRDAAQSAGKRDEYMTKMGWG